MLVKDRQGNVYVYGFVRAKWRYTKLDSAIFKDIYFPAQNEAPIFLREQDKKPEIYTEIAKLISNEQPVDFLVFYKDNYAFRNNVKGVEAGVNLLYNNQFWYFE